MLNSTLISSLGMLALCMSSFTPTARFGMLMASQMVASLLGELVLLPAMLCLRPARKKTAQATTAQPTTPPESESAVQIHPFPPAATPLRRRRA
jgi:hypothetical protein